MSGEHPSPRLLHPETSAEGLNFIVWLAAPPLFAKQKEIPARDLMLEAIGHYIEYLSYWAARHKAAAQRDGHARAKAYALQLCDLLRAWSPAPPAPADIRNAARACLAASGSRVPPQGWDHYDGTWQEPGEHPPASEEAEPPISARSAAASVKHAVAMRDTQLLMEYLALPKLVARYGKMPSRAYMLQTLDGFIDALDVYEPRLGDQPAGHGKTVGDKLRAERAHARALRGLIARWTPSVDVPAAIRQTARAWLNVSAQEPGEGWDEFDDAWDYSFPEMAG